MMKRYIKKWVATHSLQFILGIFIVAVNTSCCITGYCQIDENQQHAGSKEINKEK
ncbi:hypothetical protein [uncultured Dysgonomonas sp.]|uniref:hypothetical protein n=1 Tax=Dysgonomonas mossii TaxID=163665 RepID=UPI0028060BCA|nr:hypothetical protein [uncultured Dysgonomonas sp.]